MSFVDPLGLAGYSALGDWIGQPSIQDKANETYTQYENSLPQPKSDWEFTGWDVNSGKKFGSTYKTVNAMCRDQFGNEKSVYAKYFQTGPFINMNEVDAGRGIPDPSEDSSDIAALTETNVDNTAGLTDAHSMAKKCGASSGYQCFMDTEASPSLGKKLCQGGQ